MALSSNQNVSFTPGPGILVISVKMSTGEVTQHGYPVPGSEEGVAELISRTIARIDDAFNPATPRGFILENPVTIYNLDQVLSISIQGLSPEQLDEIARKTEQHLGFKRTR
jgi:hypothetical protein